jgi:hypothetical protein
LASGFALVAAIVLWWDSLRWRWAPSFWERSAATYGELALASPGQIDDKLAGWLELLSYALGGPMLLLLALLLGVSLIGVVTRRRRERATANRGLELLLAAFVVAYVALHLATSLAAWDRYALPLVPLLALLLARLVVGWLDRWRREGRRLAMGALAALAATGAVSALLLLLSPAFPVGNASAYDAVPALASYLRRSEPGAVVYHRHYGWHFGFYLDGAGHDLRWWQSPADLARLAQAELRPQLIAFPAADDRSAVEAALAGSGLSLQPVMAAAHADGSPAALLFRIAPATGVAGSG